MSNVNEKMTSIADEIRDKTGTTDKLSLDEMAAEISNVYDVGKEEGRKKQYDEFWDNFQDRGKRQDYSYAFGLGWYNENFKPKYKMTPSTLTAAFDNMKCTDYDFRKSGVNIDYTVCSSFQSAFRDFKGLTAIVINYTGYASNFDQCFYGCTGLEYLKIDVHAGLNFYNNAFYNCTALTDLTVTGIIGKTINLKWSPLNKASIKSVINALSKTTSGIALTLKKTAVNDAFGIDIDDETTYPVGSEYYELRHSKDNWTISYM